MSRRVNMLGLVTISGICIFLLLFASHRTNNYQMDFYRPRPYYHHHREAPSSAAEHFNNGGSTTQNASIRIQDVILSERERILEEMMLFDYPAGQNNQPAQQLSDLTPETDGNPIRSIIITTWRSGSTFLGDILNAMPGNYYHYEPLLNFDIIQVRSEPLASQAVANLKKLLHCDYNGPGMRDYLEYGQTHTYLFKHNTRLWRLCQVYPNFCWRPDFLTPLCRLFPLQSMKVVRLRLAIASQLLDDPGLNVRIVLLIRDPRGTLQSRKHREWCPGRPDCDHPPTLCRDMVADYYAAQLLLKKYPDRFRVVRYEDLSLDPYDMTKEILQFYGLPMDPEVEEFLESHTKHDIGGVSSTYRDSKSAPFHWIKDLSYEEIDTIQNGCTKAMELWGYKKATNSSILSSKFDPLLPYSLT
ncbi:carbohydrate sulfotransferase 4 [Sergentomyia squamirostris]